MMKPIRTLTLMALGSLLAFNVAAQTVYDMRGKAVTLPDHVQKVATLDDGFVEAVLTNIGEIDKVKTIGSWSMKRDYKYSFEGKEGRKVDLAGWNTMKALHPWLNELACVNSPQGDVIDFEKLVAQKPDVVIVRVGDCTVRSVGGSEKANQEIATMEKLGLPVIVLYSPTHYINKKMKLANNLITMKEEAIVIGNIFGKGEQAGKTLAESAKVEEMIADRTRDIPEKDRVKLLYFGLSPKVRKSGGAGTVHGRNTPENYIIEDVVHAKNAYDGVGSGVPMSAEQIYALDPDVIVLPTMHGYHPPMELLESPYYSKLSELRAVKNKRVYAMPWSPMNCSRRMEYPIDMLIIAKAAYPEKFKDINVYQWVLDFYQRVYHVDLETAKKLRSHQLLDWMGPIGF